MENSGGIISIPGVFACCGGVVIYWLSRNRGRDVNALKEIQKVESLKDLTAILEASRKPVPVLVAVAGRVAADAPLTCLHSNLRGVILEETAEQNFLKHNESGSWVQDSAVVMSTSKEVPWFLDDGTLTRVYVIGARSAVGAELAVASEVFEALGRSLVWGTLDYLQGLKMLGVKRTEKILPIGTNLTVVGEAVQDDRGSLRLQKPPKGPFYVTPKSLDQLIASIGTMSRFYKWLSMGCTVVGLCLLAKKSLNYFMEGKRRKEIRQRVRDAAALMAQQDEGGLRRDASSPEEGGSSETEVAKIGQLPNLCVICLEQKYTSVFFPCGHMCCCHPCSTQLSSCPLCRRRIEQTVKAFPH